METFVTEMTGLVGKWADPDGTAMSGQPVTESEQAPDLHRINLSPFTKDFRVWVAP